MSGHIGKGAMRPGRKGPVPTKGGMAGAHVGYILFYREISRHDECHHTATCATSNSKSNDLEHAFPEHALGAGRGTVVWFLWPICGSSPLQRPTVPNPRGSDSSALGRDGK